MGVIILLSIIIVLVIILFAVIAKDNAKNDKEEAKCFEEQITIIMDKLQTGDTENIDSYFKEVMAEDSSRAEFYVVFANILRERGHFNDAINIHKSVLKRQFVEENRIFKGWVLGNLSEDFRKAGMIDRALRTYNDALALLSEKTPNILKSQKSNKEQKFSRFSKDWLKTLLKRYIILCKQVGDYQKLLSLTDMLHSIDGFSDEEKYKREVAFIYNQLGENEVAEGNEKKAVEFFKKGLSICRELYPAYLNLANIYKKNKKQKAMSFIEQLVKDIPKKGFLVLPLVREINENKFEDICFALLNGNDNDWRVRLELGRYYMDKGEREKGLKEFKKCLVIAPMVLIIHQEIWKYLLKHPEDTVVFKEYANTLNEVLVFNNPFVCTKCNYKSSEFLWKCPYCHEFDTFSELKI